MTALTDTEPMALNDMIMQDDSDTDDDSPGDNEFHVLRPFLISDIDETHLTYATLAAEVNPVRSPTPTTDHDHYRAFIIDMDTYVCAIVPRNGHNGTVINRQGAMFFTALSITQLQITADKNPSKVCTLQILWDYNDVMNDPPVDTKGEITQRMDPSKAPPVDTKGWIRTGVEPIEVDGVKRSLVTFHDPKKMKTITFHVVTEEEPFRYAVSESVTNWSISQVEFTVTAEGLKRTIITLKHHFYEGIFAQFTCRRPDMP
jgi:hypothetical protein